MHVSNECVFALKEMCLFIYNHKYVHNHVEIFNLFATREFSFIVHLCTFPSVHVLCVVIIRPIVVNGWCTLSGGRM